MINICAKLFIIKLICHILISANKLSIRECAYVKTEIYETTTIEDIIN